MSRRPPHSSKPEADGDASSCARTALGLLARREHSRLELERKLGARGYARGLVEEVLDRLESSGALAAERFAESFIRERSARGQGPLRLRAELAGRGIADDVIAAALRTADCDWADAARRVRVKRFGAERPATRVERAKQARFLEYRGFAAEQIRAALSPSGETD